MNKKPSKNYLKPALYGMFIRTVADLSVIGYDLFKAELLTAEQLGDLEKMNDSLLRINKKIKEKL